MSSISTAPPRLYPAPFPHGNRQLTGLRGWVAGRPLAGFLGDRASPELAALLYTGSCLLWCQPVPICGWRFSRLASTLLILLPTALWVTSIIDGRAGVRAL